MEQIKTGILEKQQAFDEYVRRNLRWNFTTNLLYGLFGTTGWQLIMAPLFVPAYVKELGGTNMIVGLVLFCGGLSRFLTPLVTAPLVEHEPYMKFKSVIVGSFMRVQLLFMALAGFFLARWLNLIEFFIVFSLFNLFMGMQNVVYQTVMSKVIPVDTRGRFVGLRNFLAGVSVSLVAFVAGSFIEHLEFPHSYAATFLLAFILTSIGLVFFAFSREPATPAVPEQTPIFERIRSVPSLIKKDKNYGNYLACCSVGSFAMMANPFFINYVHSSLSISGSQFGLIAACFYFARTSANLVLGPIADRKGFRLVFMLSAGLWISAMITVVILPMSHALAIFFFLAFGAGMSGYRMSMNNMVFEFGSTAERPMRIAVVNSVIELSNAFGPLLAGYLADEISYQITFVISIVCAILGLIMMYTLVTEPRNVDG